MTQSSHTTLLKLLESMISASSIQKKATDILLDELRCVQADIISSGPEMSDDEFWNKWMLINSALGDCGQAQHLIDQKFELVYNLFDFPAQEVPNA